MRKRRPGRDAAEVGARKRPRRGRLGHPRAAELGAAEVGLGEDRACQVDAAGPSWRREHGRAEVASGELAAGEVGAREVGAREDRAA